MVWVQINIQSLTFRYGARAEAAAVASKTMVNKLSPVEAYKAAVIERSETASGLGWKSYVLSWGGRGVHGPWIAFSIHLVLPCTSHLPPTMEGLEFCPTKDRLCVEGLKWRV